MNKMNNAPLNFGKKLWLLALEHACNEANIDMEGIEYDSKLSNSEDIDVVAFCIPEFDVGVVMKDRNSYGLCCGASVLGLTTKQILSKAWDKANLNADLDAVETNVEKMAVLLRFLSDGYKVLSAHRSEIEDYLAA